MYILPLLTQLGCVCLPRFSLFCLCIYDLVFLFCCLCIFAFWFSPCCWFSFVLQEQHVFPSIPTYHFWRTKKFKGNTSTDWIPRVPNQPSSKCKKHCKQFVELARCARVMTTQAEFHLSRVYTSLPRPGHWGSEQPIHWERPVATQHPLRNCVDHLAAPSHIYAPPRVETGQ